MLAKLGIKKSKSNLNLNSSQALERRNNELFRSHLLDSIARNLSIMHAQGWLTTGDFDVLNQALGQERIDGIQAVMSGGGGGQVRLQPLPMISEKPPLAPSYEHHQQHEKEGEQPQSSTTTATSTSITQLATSLSNYMFGSTSASTPAEGQASTHDSSSSDAAAPPFRSGFMQNIYETNANPHINNFKHRYEEDQRMAALGYVREQPGPRNANNNNNNSNKNNLITNELESKFKQFNVVSKRSDSLERANKGTSSSSSSSKFVYAHAAFESDVPGDLTFAEGVCIEVLEEVDANWWKGRIGSRIGIFPKTFVKK